MKSWRLFTFAKIDLDIHWSTLVFFALIAAFYSLEELYVVVAAFISLVPHEYGHALAARFYNITTKKIIILPLGGVALLESMPRNPKCEMVVTGAGPLVTLILALVFSGAALIYPSFFLVVPALVNWVLFIFNMLPVFPMDGGRFFRALLAVWIDYKKSTWIAVRIGQLIAIALMVLGIFTAAPMLALTMAFVFFLGQAELNQVLAIPEESK